ncbi:MAG: hypothetical protein RDU25_05575 [Patescibacteria group bacterium]|nr:hypothetical protein [Patescibacteria group bacterium]
MNVKVPPSHKPREPFPVVMRSTAIRRFFNSALDAIRQRHVLLLGVRQADRLELKSFFRALAQETSKQAPQRICNDANFDPIVLDEEDDTCFLFLHGEEMRGSLQHNICLNYRHLPLVAVAIEPHAEGQMPSRWDRRFIQTLSPMLNWPAWSERDEDKAEICEIVRSRILLPSGLPTPIFDPDALRFLLEKDFDGPVAVQDTIRRAMQAYRRDSCTGPLTLDAFLPKRSSRPGNQPSISPSSPPMG